MQDPRVLIDALAGFARTLTRSGDVGEVLHDLIDRVAEVLALDGVSVSLVKNGSVVSATVCSERLTDLERVLDDAEESPCLTAALTGETVAVSDLRAAEAAVRWPGFAIRALSAGIRAVAGVPMVTEAGSLGAINLYSDPEREWSQCDLTVGRTFADLATCHLVHATESERQRQTAAQLQKALDTRIVIEQAKGVVAAARGVSVDDAFQLLRRHARSHNSGIKEVADAVVRLGLRP